MIRYIHGSADSTDLDVVYVFEEMPPFKECQLFCQGDPAENRNIIVVRDGTVAQTFKGIRDEVNNALLATYPLHEQAYPLLIHRAVPRDVFLKDIAVTRKLMSPLTKTPLRPRLKEALRGEWSQRLAALGELRLAEIDFDRAGKQSGADLLKSMAFQLGQGIGLHRGVELYTKADVAGFLPQLRPYLYRQAADMAGLQEALDTYRALLAAIPVQTRPDRYVQLPSGAVYDIHRETRIV